jgi:hypothetical protein
MIDADKIKWLGTEWSPVPYEKRPKGREHIIDSIRYLKSKVEQCNKEMSQLNVHDSFECNKIMNRTIRRTQELVKKIQGKHYTEKLHLDSRRTAEHVIPQNLLSEAYKEGHISFEMMISMPIVDLSESSDALLQSSGQANINEDWLFPFMRYEKAGIGEKIYLPNGIKIKHAKWSLEDHFKVYPEIVL